MGNEGSPREIRNESGEVYSRGRREEHRHEVEEHVGELAVRHAESHVKIAKWIFRNRCWENVCEGGVVKWANFRVLGRGQFQNIRRIVM